MNFSSPMKEMKIQWGSDENLGVGWGWGSSALYHPEWQLNLDSHSINLNLQEIMYRYMPQYKHRSCIRCCCSLVIAFKAVLQVLNCYIQFERIRLKLKMPQAITWRAKPRETPFTTTVWARIKHSSSHIWVSVYLLALSYRNLWGILTCNFTSI